MNKSEQKTKKPRNGFGFRLAQAIITPLSLYFLSVELIECLVDPNSISIYEAQLVSSGITVVYFFLTVFTFVLAFLGKKHKWANIVCLIIYGLFCLSGVGIPFCVWGVIGGVIGINSLTPKKESVNNVNDVDFSENVQIEQPILTEDKSGESEGTHKEVITQTVVKQPSKKFAWGLFGGMVAYYSIWLIIGILSVAMPQNGIAWGPYEDEAYTVAMNITTGFIILLQLPSFGYFFTFMGPVRLSKKTSTIIVSCCVAVTVIGDFLFYLLMNKYFQLVGFSFRIAPILSEVGLIAIYFVGFLRISPEKLQKSDYQKCGSTWKDIAGEIFCTLKNVIKFFMRNRNTVGFIIGGTVAFTLCLFVLMEALYVLAGIMIILLFIVLLDSLYMRPSEHRREYRITDRFGNTHTLKYNSYNSFSGEDIYKDESGYEWATKNGGSSFYPITADNVRHQENTTGGKSIE